MKSPLLCLALVLLVPALAEPVVGNGNGTIDHDAFIRSVPRNMKIGLSYPVEITVHNHHNKPEKLYLMLQAPSEYIYPGFSYEMFKINARSSRTFEFSLVPIKPNRGKMNLTAMLYRGEPKEFLPTHFEELDRTTAVVRMVELRRDTRAGRLGILIILLIALIVALAAFRTRRRPKGGSS